MGGHIIVIFHHGEEGLTARTIDGKNNEKKGGCSRASQLEEGINKIVNEAAVVDSPIGEEDSDFLDFEEEDLDGVPDEDDSEIDEELRGFRENLRQQKRNNEAAKQKQKTKKFSKIQEVELGEAGVDRGFEDIFKNKVDKYVGRLGSDEDFIGSSDEPSEDSEE
ncbi:hypothetical protein HAX54_032962 [Datura stramonium]|uniref:Uncharacterized protein n=1 Tax=Datura stramonium TaxID=4076 RepID=A0ABS8VDQ6_DATST|nr:hypothetical protein [Datura stramonium]